MRKFVLLALLFSLVLVIGAEGCGYNYEKPKSPSSPGEVLDRLIEKNTDTPTQNNVTEETLSQTFTVQMTESGFSPKTLEINAGDKVIFLNAGSGVNWPASAIHPTHTVYPGSGIEKCDNKDHSEIFDACDGVNPGESFSFAFNEKGSWNYHDHLRPSLTGTIVVK